MRPLFGVETDRPSHAPGPGPIPDPLLRALDLEIARRIDGLFPGEFRATRLGSGTELAQIRPYEAGSDDIRDIDWNVTARMATPHVRVHVAERVVTTWLVLDVSASMSFGTSERRKADVAEGVALAVAHLATRRGNRIGLITHGEERLRILRPRAGRAGLLAFLTALRQQAAPPSSASLALTLRRVRGIFRTRSAVFLASDFIGDQDWRTPLLSLSDRHEVIGVEIRDPREQELTDIGEVWMADPETGRRVLVDTRSTRLRAAFAEAAAKERTGIADIFRSTRTGHVVLDTSGDWLRDLATFLARRKAAA